MTTRKEMTMHITGLATCVSLLKDITIELMARMKLLEERLEESIPEHVDRLTSELDVEISRRKQ